MKWCILIRTKVFLSFFIYFNCVLGGNNVVGATEVDYLPVNGQKLENNVEFVSLYKRDTGNLSEKKSAIEKKPTKLSKENLETMTEKPKVAAVTESTVAATSTKEWSDPNPYDMPSNYTFENETDSDNNTHHFVYYNATFYKSLEGKNLWIDLDNMTSENVTLHHMLSNSHRRAATVYLSFDFPFYGHVIRNITIATGGFLYTGDYMHTWLAATQYIAPLMANFDTSLSNDSMIRYVDTGLAFTVQWQHVFLQDKAREEFFTFQVTLFKTGDISFVYKSVPVTVRNITDDSHPVKVGLSDAYILEKTVVFIRRKTIYEYHRADLTIYDISNETAIYFTALPTCQNFSDCKSCMSSESNLECVWCASADRCSSGLDRHRQDWIYKKCDALKPTDVECLPPTPPPVPTKPSTDKKPLYPNLPPTIPTSKVTTPTPESPNKSVTSTTELPPYATATVAPKVINLPSSPSGGSIAADSAARVSDGDDHHNKATVGAGVVISILMIVCLVSGFGIWMVYAYKYPQSPSGQLLIRYRPSQWRWRHGEARYTAASIHI